MKKRTIFVVDDHVDVREGVKAFLSPDFHVVCFESAIEMLDNQELIHTADCALIDLRMPIIDGFSLHAELKKAGFRSPIIFMSGEASKADVIEAWRGGAVDFILKPFSGEEIKQRIDAILASDKEAGTQNATRSGAGGDLPITRREAQVLLLLGQGFQQNEIAIRLNISIRTVKMYRHFIKEKLNLNNLAEIGSFFNRRRGDILELAGNLAAGEISER